MFFFFFKQKTTYEMRISDWSSDVCSTDLMDQQRDKTPFVTAKDGSPLDKNPLKDVRVRRAISKAINRPAIVDRIMEGAAIPAGQQIGRASCRARGCQSV